MIQDNEIDGKMQECLNKMKRVEKFIDDTNFHAGVKVRRCVAAKRERLRKWEGSLADEEDAHWKCVNNYHRRYLYYYPGQLKGFYS
jgi:hypothetical protein